MGESESRYITESGGYKNVIAWEFLIFYKLEELWLPVKFKNEKAIKIELQPPGELHFAIISVETAIKVKNSDLTSTVMRPLPPH